VLEEHRPAFVTVLEMLVATTYDPALSEVSADLISRATSSLERAGFHMPSALAGELIGLALLHLVDARRSAASFGDGALDLLTRHSAR
jgi:presenilin-like A22 family membrane protease